MDQNSEKKLNLRDQLLLFFKNNKLKFFFFLILFISIVIFIFIMKSYEQKKINLISEKYIKAGIFLSTNNNEESLKLLEDIVLSKNNFYSILALNTILEKNLELKHEKILKYFSIVESLDIPQEKRDLLLLKKALYLIKKSEIENGESILKKIISSNSALKSIAEEILSK